MADGLVLDDAAGAQLVAWVKSRTNLTVLWADQPDGYTPYDYIVLSVLDSQRIGQDGLRWEHDPGLPAGQDMVPTVVGQREFTLRVEARCWSQELSQVGEAVLAPLELALQLPSAQALMIDLNLGLVSTGPIVQSDVMVDERVQSRAAMDIRFATSIQLTDATDAASYIETVVLDEPIIDGDTLTLGDQP